MKPERWKRVQEIFSAALERAEPERATFVEEACAEDATLRTEVLELLAASGEADTFLIPPAGPPTAADTPRAAPGLEGRSVGSCRLLRQIGEGGMGAVYEAIQEPWGRTVAVKLMREGFPSAEARRRFEYEARVLASLQHPAIAQVHASGTEELAEGVALPYYVMELVPGGQPITDYAESEQLDLAARIDIFCRVADAVHHGHLGGVLHRDLKPANILVDRDGRPKVIDFGVARNLGDVGPDRGLRTASGMMVGTPAYMSPEQFGTGDTPVDARSDVYALGVILYQLLCRRLPYDLQDATLVEIVSIVRDRPPIPPAKCASDLPLDVQTILLRALAKEPEHRYASAAALADDLRRYREGLPIHARPLTLGYQLKLFTRRHRGVVIAAGVVVATLIAAAVVSTLFGIEAGRRADQAERLLEEHRRIAQWVIHDHQPQLAHLAGSTALRRDLAERLREHLDRISAISSDDPELLATLADSYLAVGTTLGSPSHPSLGDTAAALENFVRARAILERLVAEHPGDAHLRRARAGSWLAVADVLAETGGGVEAAGLYNAVIGEFGGATGPEGTGPESCSLCAAAERGLAWLARGRGDLEAAVDHARRCLDLHARGAEPDDGTWAAIRPEVVARCDLARLLVEAGRSAEAVPLLSICREEYAGRVDPVATDPLQRSDGAVIESALGDAFTACGEPAPARRHHLRALELRREIAATNPSNMGYLAALATSLEHLADLGLGAGEIELTVAWSGESVELRERILKIDPHNLGARLALRRARTRAAMALLRAGELEAAERGFETAREEAETIAADAAGSVAARRGVADAWQGLGVHHLVLASATSAVGERREVARTARKWLRKSLDTFVDLESTAPRPAWLDAELEGARRYLAVSDELLAEPGGGDR